MSFCQTWNDGSRFRVYPVKPVKKNTENLKTKDLIEQLERLSLSTSDYEPPANKVARIRLKSKTPRSSKKLIDHGKIISESPEPEIEPEIQSQIQQEVQAEIEKPEVPTEEPDVDIGKSAGSENEQSADWFPTDDLDELAKKRRTQRLTKEWTDKLSEVLQTIPAGLDSTVLLKNGLLRIETLQSNISHFSCDEFFKRRFHQIAMNRSWKDYEIALYARKFNQKSRYMKNIFNSPDPSMIKHRRSYGQQYRTDRIDLMMKYIMENSFPNANHSNDVIIKKVAAVRNRKKREFYK